MDGRGGSEWQDDECILSQKVQDAIAEVLPSDDPIDQANFDAIEFINQNFPSDDQKSLEKIEPFVTTLSENITKLDGELSSAVQKQATAGHRAAEDIRDANQAIHELFTKIKDIKGKAEQSEVMVAEICKDIKQLDYAKRHIQETITALKRLHMVVTAVEQRFFHHDGVDDGDQLPLGIMCMSLTAGQMLVVMHDTRRPSESSVNMMVAAASLTQLVAAIFSFLLWLRARQARLGPLQALHCCSGAAAPGLCVVLLVALSSLRPG